MKSDTNNPASGAILLDFGREICNNLSIVEAREWLVTNGIGGYASGTVAGTLTRRYHGLLFAALKPPLARTLMLTKLEETAIYNGASYALFANRWRSGVVEPQGFLNLERFHLEGTTPVWTYALADALLEKRVWMQPGANTTYVRYSLQRANSPVTLTIKAMVNYRDHHASTHTEGQTMDIDPLADGLIITAFEGAAPFYLLSSGAEAVPQHEWYQNYHLSVETYRGLDALEDHLHVGDFRAELFVGESLTLVASTEETPDLDGNAAYTKQRAYEGELIDQNLLTAAVPEVQQLVLAANQFVVRRATVEEPDGHTIIAGYPWFGDWGRDTMIALPGLTLSTGRPEVARSILRTFARYVDRGMIPNRFPEVGENPEYNTVDATLWYIEALRAYVEHTGDNDTLRELFPILKSIVTWHQRGTRFNIHADPLDGLLYAGEPGTQLTWMDAKVGDWVVTPRMGKPVEINALWYNALRIMTDFARSLGVSAQIYQRLADQVETSFARFWNATTGCCYDLLDGPNGDDPALRPNQLFAVSLHHSLLNETQQRAIVDVCAHYLLTSLGLRSLAPDDEDYIGHYGGDQHLRDAAYHQGTVWGWLIGPFVQAHLHVYRDPILARSYLQPLIRHLSDHGIGSVSEIFDGDPPFTPRGCIAQAWSVAEVLRVWKLTEK